MIRHAAKFPSPPRACPSCGRRLWIAGLACSCGTGVTGAFAPCECEFCRLTPAQRELLRVFLTSRGNTKELERYLGVSYPTARARLEDVLTALGYEAGPEPRPAGAPTGESLAQTVANQARLEVLRALAGAEIEVDEALRQLD